MSIGTILSAIFIGPLKLAFEIIYVVANNFIGHPGLSIIVLSLIMNFLVLPLYKRADAMQEESRDIEAQLAKGVAHIKKTFSGDERMMILQTYYRQNNYKPTDALNGSVSLLLEVPFFMAAYQFLSNLDLIQGVSLGPIADLGVPDGLLVIGGLTINLLPVIMTLVNVISSAIYLKGFPLKTKIQLYAMALFFLVFLYESPSGLVFYWTLNNVFSLVKTVFYKLKNPRQTLYILFGITGIWLLYQTFAGFDGTSGQKLSLGIAGTALLLPFIKDTLITSAVSFEEKPVQQANGKLFFLACLLLTVLTGLLIPSAFIAASPQEYIDISYFHNPMEYIVQSVCLAVGLFIVWMRVFYWLQSPSGKILFDKVVWSLCGIMLVNYLFFGTDLGILTPNLQYEEGLKFSAVEHMINLCVVFMVGSLLNYIHSRWNRSLVTVLLTGVFALGGMSLLNISKIASPVNEAELQAGALQAEYPQIELSSTEKNVVVIMLDRAMGQYIPYIMNEKPELQQQFSGFTYYANTISLGGSTLFGVPAMYGGYEYSPVEINRRDSESMVNKHNEALKVLPVLFDENNFNVIVCNPPYANYQEIPDLSIYDEYPDIQTYNTQGQFSGIEQKQALINKRTRNFFCFSLMKTFPTLLQSGIYDNGNYNQAANVNSSNVVATIQTTQDMSVAQGIDAKFMEHYNLLASLPQMTKVQTDTSGTFMFFSSDITHAPTLLQEPEYIPAAKIDNTEYDKHHEERFISDGKTLRVWSDVQMSHYHVNMAAMIQLGNWFDHLREHNVYDNTRIILVADHGFRLSHQPELYYEEDSWESDVARFYPLFMVKDFFSTSFTTSYDFMTNADVASIAVDGLIENPKNPFTGRLITNSEKLLHDQFIILSHDWQPEQQNSTTFIASDWAKVSNNMLDMQNWKIYPEKVILKEHVFPEAAN